jgi:hypothetical protein
MHSTNASQQATLVTLLRNNGVIVLDERQLYVDDDVLIENIFPGTMIYPGVRLHGAKTVIGPGAKIGTEGPATLMNVAVGRNAEIASGFVTEAAILSNARLGSNSHVRSGTLLEEWASTAHSVGLKHTVLMSFVTMGSLINLCDCLVSGGRSRREHSEIGSGFIHFNFTPWGPDGDKATASLFGDVVEGVFLDNDRLFLGGLTGVVGPRTVGYGSIVTPGSILRKNVGSGVLVSAQSGEMEHSVDMNSQRYSKQKVAQNVDYIAQLFALYNWYKQVRSHFARIQQLDPSLELVINQSIRVIKAALEERSKRLNDYIIKNNKEEIKFSFDNIELKCELSEMQDYSEYTDWVRSLTGSEKLQLRLWLTDCVKHVTSSIQL